jgi:hypothetical protein
MRLYRIRVVNKSNDLCLYKRNRRGDKRDWHVTGIKLSLSQSAKTLFPSYYCLYSLFIKIRDKGKIVSAGYWRSGGEEGGGGEGVGGKREGVEWVGSGERNDPSLVCTYE